MEGNKFDLNIQKILEGWEVKDAVRELIANALDEQLITKTEQIQIFKDSESRWHIRDFGRGLRIENFTQNENNEKRGNDRMIGQFGIGLKDAIATLSRKGVGIIARSCHADFTFGQFSKAGYDEIKTLHAVPAAPSDPRFQGTEFILTSCPDGEIEGAKGLFLRFSGCPTIESTKYGEIVDPEKGMASIYVNGVKVNEEDNFRFSYNITSPDSKIKKALNRERTNVGRSAYRERIQSILQKCESPIVAKALADDLKNSMDGTEHEEVKWTEVALHACKLLNSAENVVYMTSDELVNNPYAVDKARQTGFTIITVPTSIRDKLSRTVDLNGKPIRDSDQLIREYEQNFKFSFVLESSLTISEQAIFTKTGEILDLIGGRPEIVKEILISETMTQDPETFSECAGLWQSDKKRIIIKRGQLDSLDNYAGTLLHEVAHARSGATDTTRKFEEELTRLLGLVSSRLAPDISRTPRLFFWRKKK